MDFTAPDAAAMDLPIATNLQDSVGNDVIGNNAANAIETMVNLPSIFDLLDLEGNGDLDFAEFKVGLNSIGVSVSHDEAITLFGSIDAENEDYINKESFMEWLSKDINSQEMIEIRDKLILALNAAQEINNPIQDMLDEDEIANILGNKAEYIQEIEEIKKETDDDESAGTFKVNRSSDESDSDSMDSLERKAIAKAKIAQQTETAQDLETSLMQKEMELMMDKQREQLEREISGRNTYREEDAAKWKKEEIDHEIEAMNQHFRRLSQASLSIDQVQDQVNKTMQEFRKLSQNKMDNINLFDGKQSPKNVKKPAKIKTKSLSPRDALNIKNIETPKSPIQEIKPMITQHTTNAQPIMITDDTPRRNSLSESYSTGYVMAPITDISHYTANQHHEPLIVNQNNRVIKVDDGDKNVFIRLMIWYLSPMHERESLHRLWYHGANAVLSIVICFISLSLFILSLVFVVFCGFGLIFTYAQCLLTRHFAQIDSRFSYYFFGDAIFPRFSIFIPKSHQQSIIGALKEYITDPHMLQLMAYFTFIKLPASFILSGIAMVIFSGVTSILLSPLIFWLDPQYFEDDLYCLFGSRTSDEVHPNKMICNGWAINSFGETFLAFVLFIPALPLTLHLSNFTANLLCRCTLNFLSINSPNSPPITHNTKNKGNIQDIVLNPNQNQNIHSNQNHVNHRL